MILSRMQLEEIAAAVLKDFEDKTGETFEATPIDRLAEDYLGLCVTYSYLSKDGSIWGVTAYADTEYHVELNGKRFSIPLKQNQVLLHHKFSNSSKNKRLEYKRRFTLAHECAHQILFQLESDEKKFTCRKQYEKNRSYSLRELKTREDWNEWQADVLGAALLLPPQAVRAVMERIAGARRLTSYGGRYDASDCLVLDRFCDVLGVSKTAAVIRLRQLGWIADRPYREYTDPLEVLA